MKKIFWRVGLYFAVALVIMTAVAGLVFTRFNRHNVMNIYKEELKSLAQSVAGRISDSMEHSTDAEVAPYLIAIEDFGDLQNTDIWILANPSVDTPLDDAYVNTDIDTVAVQANTRALINAACSGKTKSYSDYDSIYDMDMMHLATPIKNAKGDNVGVVLVNGQVDYRENSVSQYQYYMFLSVIIALVIALVISAFFSQQLVRPIIKIKKIALLMAAGQYAQKTEIRRRDELGMLADSIDVLSEKLVESEQFRNSLEQNRRDFFSNVSHELRTPITVVKGYAETLADGYVDDEEKQKEYFERIRRECVGMERLVSDLLILSKMENPDFEMDKEMLNVIAVMQDALRSMRGLMAEHGMTPVLSYDDECSLIDGDYDRIRQLFLVLLQNAVKYADKGTTLDVNIKRSKEGITISVEDTGIAVPKAEWDSVFDKFYRADNHGNKDGSGLGLMVAKHIVLRHEGKIWMTSDEINKTCFYIQIPEYKGGMADV